MPGLWSGVLASRRGGAVLSGSGEILRTWQDIESEAEEFAARLAGGQGAVALQTGNCAAFPALVLACWRTGRTACLWDKDTAPELRDAIGRELGVTVRAEAAGGRIQLIETGVTPTGARPVDLYKVTSGTSGRPKAIGFTAGQLLADSDQIRASMGISSEDITFGVISFTHSYGFSHLITPLLTRGTAVVVSGDPLPRAVERALLASRATVLPAVPAIFRGLLAADSLPDPLRLCISAGAPLAPSVAARFHERFGRKIHTFYGASECGGICYDASGDPAPPPGFVGTPLQGVRIAFSSPETPSRIRVVSPAVGTGPGIVAGAFEPEDLLVRAGEAFRILGREGDLINIAGKKVAPAEIEEVLLAHPDVSDVLVCGASDPLRGQKICALVSGGTDSESLRAHCAAALPGWKTPRLFAFVDAIPTTPRGKISRAEIAARFFQDDPGGG